MSTMMIAVVAYWIGFAVFVAALLAGNAIVDLLEDIERNRAELNRLHVEASRLGRLR